MLFKTWKGRRKSAAPFSFRAFRIMVQVFPGAGTAVDPKRHSESSVIAVSERVTLSRFSSSMDHLSAPPVSTGAGLRPTSAKSLAGWQASAAALRLPPLPAPPRAKKWAFREHVSDLTDRMHLHYPCRLTQSSCPLPLSSTQNGMGPSLTRLPKGLFSRCDSSF